MLRLSQEMTPSASAPIMHFGAESRIADIVPDPESAHEIANTMVNAGAYYIDTMLAPEQYYVWKSGVRAPCYCNCRHLLATPNARLTVARHLSDAVLANYPDATAVAGVASAGISWAALVANATGMPMTYVLSKQKEHGVGGLVQSKLPSNSKVVVVDDLVASGSSLLIAVKALQQESNAEILGIQSIINWGFEEMRKTLDGLNYFALTSYPYLLLVAMMQGLLTDEELARFLRFYANPRRGY